MDVTSYVGGLKAPGDEARHDRHRREPNAAERDQVANERDKALDVREAVIEAREAVQAVRKDQAEKVLTGAAERDDEADARDSVVEQRDEDSVSSCRPVSFRALR